MKQGKMKFPTDVLRIIEGGKKERSLLVFKGAKWTLGSIERN